MSKAGFSQIGTCNKGSLLSTPTDQILMGIRENSTLNIKDHKQVKDYRERPLRNMMNFKFEGSSLQATMKMLKLFTGWAADGADVQLVTNPQVAGGNGKRVFHFVGDNSCGIGWKYKIDKDKRIFNPTFEVAMEHDRAETFIDGADSTDQVDLGTTGDGADMSLYKAPYFLAFEAPKTTALYSRKSIVERDLQLETVGKKSIYNEDIVDYIKATLSITASEADIPNIITQITKPLGCSTVWKEKNGDSTYMGFDFNTGVLCQSDEIKNDDNDNTIKATFTGKIPIYDIIWDFSAAAGGDATADGVVGGTMKFGY